MRSSKRGSAIAEAAVIFPVIILTVLFLIHIMSALYTEAASRAKDHMTLRQQAAMESGTGGLKGNVKRFSPEDKIGRIPFRDLPVILREKEFPLDYLYHPSGRAYVIDEHKYIRMMLLLGKVVRE